MHVRSPLKNINSKKAEGGYSVVGNAILLERLGECKHSFIQHKRSKRKPVRAIRDRLSSDKPNGSTTGLNVKAKSEEVWK